MKQMNANVYSQKQCLNANHHGPTEGDIARLATTNYNPENELDSVIVTISGSGSYDPLFEQVPQEAPTPTTRVSVFRVQYPSVPRLLAALRDNAPAEGVLCELVKDVRIADKSSVLFNWECCGDCSTNSFPHSAEVFALIKWAIDSGHFTMFSDFAVKALIGEWNAALLGPAPFRREGEFGNSYELRFDPKALASSPSTQLQIVGELCAKGEAVVHALGGTVSFSVNADAHRAAQYKVSVLTEAVKEDGKAVKNRVGHALLTYPSGGNMLVSCGHWIELAKLDTNMEAVLRVANNVGRSDAEQRAMRDELEQCSEVERNERVQVYARQYVQSAAPARSKNYLNKNQL